MDQEIAIIEQNPFRCIVSFGADRQFAKFFELSADFIRDRLSLAWVRRRADHEVVREGRNLAEIKHQKIFRFFGFGSARGDQPVRQFGSEGALLGGCGISEF